MQKKSFKIFLIVCFLSFCIIWGGSPNTVSAQDKEIKKEQGSVNEGISEANDTILKLSQKIYAAALFSPQDNNKLIQLRSNLIDLWTKNPTNRELAKPFYNTAVIMKEREMTNEAIELLNIVIEHFPASTNIEEEFEEEEEGATKTVIDYSSKAQKLLEHITEANEIK